MQDFKHHVISWKFPKIVTGVFFCILCYINKVNPGLASFDIFLIFLISFSFVWKKTVK